MANPTSLTPGKWSRFQLTNGPKLPSGQQMIFYVLAPTGWTPTKKWSVLVWEHENDQGNRAYQGDDSLPSASSADSWFNNATFQGQYPFLILLPACDQTKDSGGETENFGGWTPPGDHGPNEDSVALCAQYAIANLAGDPNCVVVAGASLGGIGAWALALDYNAYNGAFGKLFTGFAPFAGVIERNGFGVGPTATQYATMSGVPIFAVHGAGDTTSQPNWDLAVWAHFSNNAPTVGGPAGAQAGSTSFRLLFDKGLSHDVWDSYVPLPKGKPIWDFLWNARLSGALPVPTPTPTAPPIADVTILTPGSGGSVLDAAGNIWTLPASGAATMGGTAVAGGGGTAKLQSINGVIWGNDAATGQWFFYSPSAGGWIAGTPPTGGTTPPPTPTPTPTPGTNPTPPGFFKVSGGKILRPDGSVFIGGGFNLNEDQLAVVSSSAAVTPGLTLFPGTRIVRVACHSYISAGGLAMFVQQLSNKQIVMVIEDHTGISKPPYTGSALATELAWYASLATAFKSNPYVWFGTFNEPGNGNNLAGIAQQEAAIYNAIRATGSNAIVFMELPSGGNPQLVGAQAKGYDGKGPMTPSLFATMYNIVWDLHYYGWVSNYSTDIPTIKAALQGSVASASGIVGAQSIPSADGLVPVVIGEFGNSTTGGAVDPNGAQVCNVVGTSGLSFIAWGWNPDPQGDQMVSGGVSTAYGKQIAELIAAVAAANPVLPPGTPTPTPTSTPIPTPVPTPPPTQPPSGPTVASVQAEIDALSVTLAKIRSDVGLL